MEKILKVLIGIALAFLLFLGLSTIFRGCGSNTDARTQQVSDMTREEQVDIDQFDDDGFEDDIDYTSTQDVQDREPTNIVETVEEYVAPVTSNTNVERYEPVAVQPEPRRQVRSVYNDDDRKYMVLAGNYLIRRNAEEKADKLRRQGYNAEIVQFDDSKFYTVCAERSNTRNAAAKISRSLKNRGIDNYIHTKS